MPSYFEFRSFQIINFEHTYRYVELKLPPPENCCLPTYLGSLRHYNLQYSQDHTYPPTFREAAFVQKTFHTYTNVHT